MEETIEDILNEMKGEKFDEPHLNYSGLKGARILPKNWAERIEKALARQKEEKTND